jgi:oligopeptide/dipeptide ABC transporter ATP-binding protein
MSPPLLSVRGLVVRFRTRRGMVHAVEGIDLDIAAGETLGLVGESGSGKTVTGRALIGLLATPPAVVAGGTAEFRPPRGGAGGAGEAVDLLKLSHREMRRIRGVRIAMVFQDPGKALNPTLTVRQQLAEVFTEHRSEELLDSAGVDPDSRLLRREAHARSGAIARRVARIPPWRSGRARLERAVDDRVATALSATRIPNPRQVMHSYPHELSGGMKQRVMIAQALACRPDLLIADEPTTALDVTIQARILDLIGELQQERGTAVLYISHDLTIVRRISRRVAVMYAGRLAESGPTEQLFEDPRHPYTRGLLAAVPTAERTRGKLTAIEGTVPELIDPAPSCRFNTRCPHVMAVCREQDPVLRAYPDGREAACFLLDTSPVGTVTT